MRHYTSGSAKLLVGLKISNQRRNTFLIFSWHKNNLPFREQTIKTRYIYSSKYDHYASFTWQKLPLGCHRYP